MSRRDDELYEVPSIVPDSEGRNIRETTPRASSAIPRSSNSTEPSSGLVRQILTVGTLLALVLLCAFFYYENARQKVLNNELQNRLAVIEAQLGVSGNTADASESLTNKVTDLGKDVKNANEEIRKLWGITNDKNKKILDSHEARLTEQAKTLDTLQNSTTELKKSSAQMEKTVGEVNRIVSENSQTTTETAKVVAEMRNSVGALQQRIAQGDPQLREALQQSTMAQEQSEQLQAKLDAIAKKISDHDDSLRSIDSFRRSISSDVNKLKQQTFGTEQIPAPGNPR
ncbi:MAG TPA: hypothetical protein PLF22_10210 [Pseudomonadales bacterium]|nr:hypothetical protein [Pseudomonadales bacterium]